MSDDLDALEADRAADAAFDKRMRLYDRLLIGAYVITGLWVVAITATVIWLAHRVTS